MADDSVMDLGTGAPAETGPLRGRRPEAISNPAARWSENEIAFVVPLLTMTWRELLGSILHHRF